MSAIEVDKLLQAVLCILVRLVVAMVVEMMLEMMMRVMIHPALRRTLINQGTRQPGASHDWSILLTLESRWASNLGQDQLSPWNALRTSIVLARGAPRNDAALIG